jgi:1,4-alpha-glucan branching enzyme
MRLDYIRDHGMTAIELMPIFGVHEDSGWGYTPTYLFAVNRDYGSPNHLKALVDGAHEASLAVILDMVLAHTAAGKWKELFSDKVVDFPNDAQVELDKWSAQVYFKP